MKRSNSYNQSRRRRDDVALDTEYRRDMLNGITVIKGELENGNLFTAIPYYFWTHRGRGEMNVWLNKQ